MMMSRVKGTPIIFQVIACIVLVAAIVVTLVGVMTTSWQNFTTEDKNVKEVHRHGLWMDCIEEINKLGRSVTNTCFYFKFHSEDATGHNHDGHNHGSTGIDSDQQNGQHVHQHKILSLPSRNAVLVLLCLASLVGIIGLLFSFCAPFVKWVSIIWTVLCFIATICSLVGVIVFFVNSHDFERSYSSSSTKTNQEHGYSFYCGLAGFALFLLATILSILTTVLHFTARRYQDYVGKNVNKTWPKLPYNDYNHHNTAV